MQVTISFSFFFSSLADCSSLCFFFPSVLIFYSYYFSVYFPSSIFLPLALHFVSFLRNFYSCSLFSCFFSIVLPNPVPFAVTLKRGTEDSLDSQQLERELKADGDAGRKVRAGKQIAVSQASREAGIRTS